MNIGVNALLCFRWDSSLKNLIPQALTLKKSFISATTAAPKDLETMERPLSAGLTPTPPRS